MIPGAEVREWRSKVARNESLCQIASEMFAARVVGRFGTHGYPSPLRAGQQQPSPQGAVESMNGIWNLRMVPLERTGYW